MLLVKLNTSCANFSNDDCLVFYVYYKNVSLGKNSSCISHDLAWPFCEDGAGNMHVVLKWATQ